LFSIEVSGHLFGPLRPSVFSFSFGCSSAKSLYLCDILRFFQWQQSAGAPVFFFWIFSDFFLSLSSENDSREGTEKISAKLPTHYGIVSAQG
jgi:hypothetical protein